MIESDPLIGGTGTPLDPSAQFRAATPGKTRVSVLIDEAREYVPAGRSVTGKENVRRLAAQARKYGLGLLFASQEPKSIENNIVSNCLSHHPSTPPSEARVLELARASTPQG